MLIPIVCTRCGQRGKVAALPDDLECVACGTGEHLDLDDRTAQVDPSDPMPLGPTGTPEQDQDMPLGDPERTKMVPTVPGAPPYSDRALATPINASRRTATRRQAADTTEWYVARSAPGTPRGFEDVSGPYASEAEAEAAKPGEGYVTYPVRSPEDQAAYERFMTGSRKQAGPFASEMLRMQGTDEASRILWNLARAGGGSEQAQIAGVPYIFYLDVKGSIGDAGYSVPGSISGEIEVFRGTDAVGSKEVVRQHISPTGQGSDSLGYAIRVASEKVGDNVARFAAVGARKQATVAWTDEGLFWSAQTPTKTLQVYPSDGAYAWKVWDAGTMGGNEVSGVRGDLASAQNAAEEAAGVGLFTGSRKQALTHEEWGRLSPIERRDWMRKATPAERAEMFGPHSDVAPTAPESGSWRSQGYEWNPGYSGPGGEVRDQFFDDYYREPGEPVYASKVDQIVAAVRKANPWMGLRTALRVAQQTVARYPAVAAKTSLTYGEGVHFSGSTYERALEAAKQAAEMQKRIVREEFWEDYVVLNKGDQGVYSAYKASAWTPHGGDSVLPFEPPPPGTIVARVSPDGQVRTVNEKVGSRRTATPNPVDEGVKDGKPKYETGTGWGH